MNSAAIARWILVSCLLSLTALALMAWSIFDPRPLPVIASMSLGQVLGTLSLGIFGYVALADLRAQIAHRRASARPPPPVSPV
jgi:uncharacterized membrane protein YbhN (UPF0104 family)